MSLLVGSISALKVRPTMDTIDTPHASSNQMGLLELVSDWKSGCMDEKQDARQAMLLAQIGNSPRSSLAVDNASDAFEAGFAEPSPVDLGRKPIFWVHLHNFGGTYVCHEAARQNERGPTTRNCLLKPEGCSTRMEKYRIHCEERAARSDTNTFSMAERAVEDSDFCDKMLSGVMIRDPVAAALSTLRNEKFDKYHLLDVLKTSNRSGVKADRVKHGPCLPFWDTYEHFDNFATRSLGGEGHGGYMSTPPRQVSRVQFEKAKARLKSIDVVLILEELEDHFPQLESSFGWNTTMMTPGTPVNTHCSRGKPERMWTDEERKFLKELNHWDYKLYKAAQRIAAHKTKLAQKKLAAAK
eukprot:CAMPEP_0178454160 /NCGR_PEP_ID=MMETSP0689_2-20121128/45203_1 /TAXON_ID=160604 /ORGANISM="Amphidinium massartii, Strain CS-259" /LENGTH=354 /DNA_ID=CAMNT_0020080061 /DNA_START=75 /DNA_END=1139 /DNA_ORIENTATION=-